MNETEFLRQELEKFKRSTEIEADVDELQDTDELSKYLLKMRKMLEQKKKESHRSAGNTIPTLRARANKYKQDKKRKKIARRKNRSK